MTDYTLHCPVCNQQLTGQIDAETEEARCPEGHWGFEYDHGVFFEFVGEQQWHWSKDTPYDEVDLIDSQINTAILNLQEQLDA